MSPGVVRPWAQSFCWTASLLPPLTISISNHRPPQRLTSISRRGWAPAKSPWGSFTFPTFGPPVAPLSIGRKALDLALDVDHVGLQHPKPLGHVVVALARVLEAPGLVFGVVLDFLVAVVHAALEPRQENADEA